MNKILLLFISLLCTFKGFAQDPDLFGTWYITKIAPSKSGQTHVSSVNPPIQPTMTFLNTSSSTNVEGNLGCNDYTMDLQYDAVNNIFEIISSNIGTNFCNPSVEAWENLFLLAFGTNIWMYTFTQDNGITELRLNSVFEDDIWLQNVPLAVNDISQNLFSIYPNPVADQLFISSENLQIEALQIYEISGKQVLNVERNQTSIDVSNLSEGLYFIEISSSEGKSVQKFVKH